MTAGIVVSTAAARRLAAAAQWLGAKAPAAEVLILASTRRAADDFLHRYCAEGVFGVYRLTLGQLAAELAVAHLSRDGRLPVTALGMEALVTRSVHGARQAGELDTFAPVAGLPGFPRALARTLYELRSAGVTAQALAGVGGGGGDLGRLLDRYEDELASWSLVDPADVMAEARRRSRQPHRLLGLDCLLLDVSPRPGTEARLVESVLRQAPRSLATLPVGDDLARRSLEEALDTSAVDLDDPARPIPDLHVASTGRPDSRLERLRSYVFRPQLPPGDAAPEAEDQSVDFFSAPGEGRECVEIARRIQALARGGVPFDDVAVLLRDPEVYHPLLEDALRRGGIAAYFSRGTRRPDPAGRAFLALLACAAEGLCASRFAEYLSLGQVPGLDPRGAPEVKEIPWVEPQGDQLVLKTPVEPEAEDVGDPAREEGEDDTSPVVAGTLRVPFQWERLLVDASVVGGQERWARRLAGLAQEIELQIQEVGDEEEGRDRHLREQLERLGHLRRFALPVIDALAALPRQAVWGEWLDALEGLAARVLRRPESVLGLLAELRPMADVGPVELEQVRSVLTERLSFLRREPPERRYGRVLIATLSEAAGRSFHTVFLPGLAEGMFPKKAVEDPLLLDQARRELARDLTVQDDRVRDERLLLRIAAGCAESRLVVSYPRIDTRQGRARVPSFYALDVLRAAEGELPDLAALEKRAARASTARLGWPAPERIEEAVDDTEYDLALLGPLLHGPPKSLEETRGRGRFLLHANPRLARSLRARWTRWRKAWSRADGLLDASPEAKAALERHLPGRRSYSPTALQTYAGCPYRFLLYAVHRLRPREELASLEQLDPLTRGSLFHETQFQLFGELQAAALLPMRQEELPRLLDIADAVLDRMAEAYRERLAPAIPRVWRDEIEAIRTDLRGWILKVVEDGGEWRPLHFEFAFGLRRGPERDPASVEEEAVLANGLRLRGAIDLVEIDGSGTRLRVTDHKTGRAPAARQITVGGGQVLQPLLYALAAERLLVKPGQRVESGRLFYCTRRGHYQALEVELTDATRREMDDVLATIDRGIRQAFLPAAPAPGQCRFCDYRLVCGPLEELRVGRKPRQPLEELRTLRRKR